MKVNEKNLAKNPGQLKKWGIQDIIVITPSGTPLPKALKDGPKNMETAGRLIAQQFG